jgi:uncharacterized membrane protein (UPF0127 family)
LLVIGIHGTVVTDELLKFPAGIHLTMLIQTLRHLAIAFTIMLALASSSAIADVPADPSGKPQTGLMRMALKVGNQNVHADIANTESTRQFGLMFRQKMAKDEGMLFVFPEIGYHAMWMRNTLIPLSVAYMDERGAILSIHEMQPLSDDAHQAAGPARYALEMNAKWFSNNKVRVGDVIKGLDKAPKPH